MNMMTLAVSLMRHEPYDIDPLRSARELDVAAKARRDAQHDVLADGTGPGATEIEIDHFHDALRQQRSEALADRLAAEQSRQAALRQAFEQPGFAAVVQDLAQQAFAHRSTFGERAKALHEQAQCQQLDNNAFRDAAGLARQLIEPASLALHWALLVSAVVVEAMANTPFFAAGNMLGIVGGLSVALCVAALNVALAAGAGVVLRFVNHVDWRIKAAALAFGGCYAALLLGFHLGVAHWRNALAGLFPGVSPEDAGRAALTALVEFPFSLQTIEACALLLIGLSFALLALVAAYRGADPYPGYSAQVARLREATSALGAHKDGYLGGLNAIFEGEPRRGGRPSAEERLQPLYQGALAAMGSYRASAAQTARLQLQYGAMLAQVEASRTYCHSRYRQGYRAVRQCAPARFAQSDAVRAPAVPLELARYTPAPLDEPALHAALAGELAASMAKLRAVQRQYLEGAPALFAELGLAGGRPSAAVVASADASADASRPAPDRGTRTQAPVALHARVARLPWRLGRRAATREPEPS